MLNRRVFASALVAAVVFSVSAVAQSPYLVTDLNTGTSSPRSSNPVGYQGFGDKIYFFPATQDNGRELWTYDGSTVSMLKNIHPGSSSSFLSSEQLTDIGGGVLLFRAYDPQGAGIWRTDGTTAGTTKVKNLGFASGNYGAAGPRATLNGRLFFMADDGVHGKEPWFSDGTEAGTQFLFDLDGTSAASNVTMMTVLNGQLLIFGNGALWTSDGTAAATAQIATVGDAQGLARIGSTVYFTATGAGGSGRELWKSDGTTAGTQMVADIAPGAGDGANQFFLTPVGSTLYFIAAADSVGADLWKTDGTAPGTQFVKTLTSSAGVMTPAGGVTPGGLLFVAVNGALWVSNGTDSGTVVMEATGVGSSNRVATAFGRIYYLREFGDTQLWSTDGLTKSVVSSWPIAGELTATGGKLYFNGSDSTRGVEPWISEDGTTATTHLLANLNPDVPGSSAPTYLTAAGDQLFFTAIGSSAPGYIFRSDGTAAGTVPLVPYEGSYGPEVGPLTGWRNALAFVQGSGRLWYSDGTVAGTSLLKDFGFESIGIPPFGSSRYLYFRGASALWRSDGTVAGTIQVGDELPAGGYPDSPGNFVELAGRVYFMSGGDLWRTEGDSGTTQRIFAPAGTNSIDQITPAAGALFFANATAEAGYELWRSDGTAGGASLVKDIAPGPASSIQTFSTRHFTAAGRYLYFVANDGTHGAEVWRSDGTAAGTIMLTDIPPSEEYTIPLDFTSGGELLYFVMGDGVHGRELWRSDGTPGGTVMVADLNPGSASSAPSNLTYANGTLWFRAEDGTSGAELWRLDGTTPVLAGDLVPGPQSSSPFYLTGTSRHLFFSANVPATGRELWAVEFTGSLFNIDDVRTIEGTGGTRTLRFTVTRTGSTSGTASVAFATNDGTATGGIAATDDYVAQSGTLTFTSGQTSRFIDVTVNADSVLEGSESFFVVLSSPSGALLGQGRGTGIIDDDDHRAELSIAIVQSPGETRVFRVTNAGPSTATNVRLRYSISPGNDFTGCTESSANLPPCGLESIGPGETRYVHLTRSLNVGYVDPAAPPGFTVTADVSAAEVDSNPADNAVSHLISTEGILALPPFLTSGTSAPALVTLQYNSTVFTRVTPTSSSPNVVVSPSFIDIAPGQSVGSFSLAAGAGTGRVKLAATVSGWPGTAMMVPVVASGTTPKLDVSIFATGSFVEYGTPATVAVEVAARRHDGTRPTGMVSLLDASQTVVAQQSLDGDAKTVFSLNGLEPGRRTYYARYEGDANFNALAGADALVVVNPWHVEVEISVPPLICAGTTHDIVVLVQTSSTATAPSGSVKVSIENSAAGPISIVLTPTGTPGQSRAVLSHQFLAGQGTISVEYVPTGNFGGTNGYRSLTCAPCAPLNVRATATSNSTVAVQWSPIAGAANYQLMRMTNRWNWTYAGQTPTTSLNDINLEPLRSYLYTVVALNASGNLIGYGIPDVATTMTFADDPLTAGVTKVRASHIEQLRMGANALRWFGISADITAISPVSVGSTVRASDINALRTDIAALRLLLGLAPTAYTDPTLAAGTKIKAVHIEELRQSVK